MVFCVTKRYCVCMLFNVYRRAYTISFFFFSQIWLPPRFFFLQRKICELESAIQTLISFLPSSIVTSIHQKVSSKDFLQCFLSTCKFNFEVKYMVQFFCKLDFIMIIWLQMISFFQKYSGIFIS